MTQHPPPAGMVFCLLQALTRDARMKPEDLPAWRDVLVEQSPDGVPPNILLHKNSLKVNLSSLEALWNGSSQSLILLSTVS